MTERVRHRWFDAWLGAKGGPLLNLVSEVTAQITAHEESNGGRMRKRSAAHQDAHDHLVTVITTNLAREVLLPSDTGRLAILTGNAPGRVVRYTGPVVGTALREHVHLFDHIGAAEFLPPERARGEASSLAPTATFAEAVRRHGVALADFGRRDREEVIRLSQRVPMLPRAPRDRHELDKIPVAYHDTEVTEEMREEVRQLNAFVEGADIRFDDDGGPAVDCYDRVARRHFVQLHPDWAPRFDQGGRLYGGFWQNLERGRRASIRINGEPVADLDFSSMFTRLAYARIGERAPEGDLYAIPGLEDHRPSVKLLVNAFLFDNYNRTTWPVEAEEALPPKWTVPDMRRAILAKHPALRTVFGKRVGHDLMFTESRILMRVLTELRSRGVVALGMHDGLMVPMSRAPKAAKIMMEVGRSITRQCLPVAIKTA